MSAGTRAVITYDSMNWLNIEPGKGRRRKSRKGKIEYPLFASASELVDDSYWEAVLISMSKGKFPKWFSCNNGRLIYRKKNNYDSILLPKDPQTISIRCIEYIKDKSSVMSDTDKAKEKEKMRALTDELTEITSWKGISKEKVRHSLISDYVIRKGKELRLTFRELSAFSSLINTSICLGQIDNNDIVIRNSRIVTIHGIIISEGTFSLDPMHMNKFKVVRTKSYIPSDVYLDPNTRSKAGKKKIDIMSDWISNAKNVKPIGSFMGSRIMVTGMPVEVSPSPSRINGTESTL